MTIKEMHSWFDILQMKGNNVEFTIAEKDHILNRAQLKYVNNLVYKVYILHKVINMKLLIHYG